MGKKAHTVRLAVTAGDPFGIGPEVIEAACEGLGAHVTIFGDPAQFPKQANVVAIPTGASAPEPRGPTEPGGRARAK